MFYIKWCSRATVSRENTFMKEGIDKKIAKAILYGEVWVEPDAQEDRSGWAWRGLSYCTYPLRTWLYCMSVRSALGWRPLGSGWLRGWWRHAVGGRQSQMSEGTTGGATVWLRVTHLLVTPHHPWCSDRLCSHVFLSGYGVITLHDGACREFSASTPVPPLHLSLFIISSPITFHPKRREKLCRWQHDLPNKSTNYGGNRTLEGKTQMRGRC